MANPRITSRSPAHPGAFSFSSSTRRFSRTTTSTEASYKLSMGSCNGCGTRDVLTIWLHRTTSSLVACTGLSRPLTPFFVLLRGVPARSQSCRGSSAESSPSANSTQTSSRQLLHRQPTRRRQAQGSVDLRRARGFAHHRARSPVAEGSTGELPSCKPSGEYLPPFRERCLATCGRGRRV